MVLLDKINIDITRRDYTKSSSFIIERFVVPDNLEGVLLSINMTYDHINLVLVYDSCYNLRAETTQMHEERLIKIHEKELNTSSDAKHGLIPEGEWIIAFEIDSSKDLPESKPICTVEVKAL